MQRDDGNRFDAFPSLSGKRYFVPPEHALLYHAGNLATPIGDDQQSVLLQPSLRWDKVLALSEYHGVFGLVRRFLRECCPPGAA